MEKSTSSCKTLITSLCPPSPFLLAFFSRANRFPSSNSDLRPMAAKPTAFEREQMLGMAEKEMEFKVDLFNRLTHTCFNKCIDNGYKEAELNMGENSCIDRCVSKYWQVTNLVGQLLGSGRPSM